MGVEFHIQWHITNLCNLRCKHCYQDDFSTHQDLDWPSLKKLADSVLETLRQWNSVASIHLTGGEPLLKPELFPLLAYLDESPQVHELGLITNGLLLSPETMERSSAFSKLKKIKISLDGPTAEINDSIRQTGVFDRVVRNLKRIGRGNRFEFIFMFTLMKRNFRNLPTFIQLCQDLGMDGLILERFIPWGRGREILDEVFDKNQWREFLEMLSRFFSMDEEPVSLLPYQAFQVRFRDGATELLGAPCIIGTEGFCLMPDGAVLPCRRFPISVGNLLDASLVELWESELLVQLREKENLKGKCRSCDFASCRGCRSLALALTGDFLQEDPHCPLTERVMFRPSKGFR